MVELILTLIIAGALAVVAIPQFSNRTVFSARGFHDEVVTALQFARQQAIAQRRLVCVTVTTNTVTVARAGAPASGLCDLGLQNPATGGDYVLFAPNGVTLAGNGGTALPLALSFDALGQSNTGAVLNIVGDGTRSLTVEAGTGYVHCAGTC